MPEQLGRLATALSDRYEVTRELGSGGMATVYLAEDLKHGRNVAIKVLKPELASALGPERFLREIEIAAGLDHPHILPLYDSGEADGFLYYVMPYVEGESLRQRLEKEKQLPLEDALRIAREVADALSYAHSRDVVHRDIKPGNILLTEGHARVADFGIARAISAAGGENLTATGASIGTPLYMSPEQIAGSTDLDGRSDLYSLGCVLFECLAGQAPFTGSPEAVVRQHLSADPPDITNLRPAVPGPVAAALMRALAKTPADRFRPAAQFAEALRSGATATAPAPAPRPSIGPGLAAGAFGLTGLIILGVVYLLVLQLGLPMWVFGAAIVLLLIGLPLVITTASLERNRDRGADTGSPLTQLFSWRRTLTGGGLAFGALALVTAAGALGVGPGATLISSGEMGDRERLILADFENRTDDPSHGTTATELMRIGLSESTAISPMDPLQLNRTLQLMRRDASEGITEEVAMAAAEREGLKGIITGEVASVGNRLTVSARLVSTEGEVLLAEAETAASTEELVDAVDRLSDRMRERFGESLRDIRAGRPLERVTTGSIRGMRLFTQGMDAWNQGDQTRAMELLEEAITEDTLFAMAYRKIAIILSNENEQRARAVAAATKAYEYRDRLTERERYLVIAAYHSVVTGNRDQQISAYRTVLDMYPDESYALNNLGVIYGQLRDYERASDLYGRALAVDPTLRLHFSNLSGSLARQKRWDTATVIADLFAERFPTNPEVKLAYVLNAAYQKQYDSAQVLAPALLAEQRGSVFWEALAYEWWGHLDALQGQIESARERWRRSFQISMDRGIRGTYLFRMARRAVVERLLLDDPVGARRLLDDALALHPLEELTPLDRPYGHLAFAYASAGRPDLARSLLAEYEATPEADHAEEAEKWAEGARGVIALAEERYEEALSAFREFDDGNECATCAYPWLAGTYDRLGQEDSVRVNYERLVDLPSSDLWYDGGHLARAYLRLGEIYEARGDRVKAMEYYSQFLDLWEDADPRFQPWVEEARAAMRRLGRGAGGRGAPFPNHGERVTPDLTALRTGARLLRRLPGFLRRTLDLEEARRILARRLEIREARFLGLIREIVYADPVNPYRQLLDHAGCEQGDIQQLVEKEGIEGALAVLLGKGVYLSVEEFKGRTPVKRGSLSFSPDISPPRNPLCEPLLAVQSSGSRGRSGPVLIDLAYIRACAVNASLVLDARGGSQWLKADWETPGGSRFRLLKYSCFGAPPVRWFSQLHPEAPQLDPVHRWSQRAMRWGSRLSGVSLPGPIYASVDDPIRIAEWAQDVVREGRTPHLFTFPSSAVCLCQSAWEAGIDLNGFQLTIGGEPITEARLRTIRRAGATAMPRYGTMECGPIGYGCMAPEAVDDVHVQHDLHALIQGGSGGERWGFRPEALFISTLHPAAPLFMLNASMGDQAIMRTRTCGCPLEEMGWVTHLRDIRSFEKLTGSGMTFLDTDVIPVLEEDLPAAFGGAPTDYQLVEKETEHGHAVLSLLIHPDLGPLDPDAVAETFLSALGARSPENSLMALAWRGSGIVNVERQAPRQTRSGKILHFHVG